MGIVYYESLMEVRRRGKLTEISTGLHLGEGVLIVGMTTSRFQGKGCPFNTFKDTGHCW